MVKRKITKTQTHFIIAISIAIAVIISGIVGIAPAITGSSVEITDSVNFGSSDLKITEIRPNPVGSDTSGSEQEWIEVQNTGTSAVTLYGNKLYSGIDTDVWSYTEETGYRNSGGAYTSSYWKTLANVPAAEDPVPITLEPGEVVIFARNEQKFRNTYPGTECSIFDWTNKYALNNNKDTFFIRDGSSGASSIVVHQGYDLGHYVSDQDSLHFDLEGGLVEAAPTPCVGLDLVQDEDGDGVVDDEDLCFGSELDNINLNPNHYAQNEEALTDELIILYEEDFEEYKKGEIPEDWDIEYTEDCNPAPGVNKIKSNAALGLSGCEVVEGETIINEDPLVKKITVEYDVYFPSNNYEGHNGLFFQGDAATRPSTPMGANIGTVRYSQGTWEWGQWTPWGGGNINNGRSYRVELNGDLKTNDWNHIKATIDMNSLQVEAEINGELNIFNRAEEFSQYLERIGIGTEESWGFGSIYFDNIKITTYGEDGVRSYGLFEEGPNSKSEYTQAMTKGCTCKQILNTKPGSDKGELETGCTAGTMDNWIQGRGWAKDLGDASIIISDDFSDGILAENYDFSLGEYATLSEVKGKLLLNYYQSNPGEWIEEEPMFIITEELDGNFEVSIDYNIPSKEYMDNVEIAILTIPFQNGARVFYVGFSPDGTVSFRERDGGGDNIIGEAVAYPKTGTVKIVRQDGDVSGYLITGNKEILLGTSSGSTNPAATETVYFQPSILVLGNDLVTFDIYFDNLVIKKLAPTEESDIIDDFEDNEYTDSWDVIEHGTLTQQNGVLKSELDGVTQVGACASNRLVSKVALVDGDFDISVDFAVNPEFHDAGQTNGGIKVTNLPGSEIFSAIIRNYAYTCHKVSNGVGTQIGIHHEDSTLSGKLRISRTGTILKAYYYENGAYHEYASVDYPKLKDNLKIILHSWTCDTNGDGSSPSLWYTWDNLVFL